MHHRNLLFSLPIILLLGWSGCTTPVAIDPLENPEQTATYSGSTFTGPLRGSPDRIFVKAIRVMDAEGYFRTGEVHRPDNITIYARKVGDKRVIVRIRAQEDGTSEISIRIGRTGDLQASQVLYSRIRAAL